MVTPLFQLMPLLLPSPYASQRLSHIYVRRDQVLMPPSLPSSPDADNKHGLMLVNEAPFESQCVLASCHSLVLMEGNLVGDPLEKAALLSIEWNLTKGTTADTSVQVREILHKFNLWNSFLEFVDFHLRVCVDFGSDCLLI